MWDMPYMKYTDTHVEKYTVYVKCKENLTLPVNHMEVGVNYKAKEKPMFRAMTMWDPDLVKFSTDPFVLNYAGVIVAGAGMVD
jgi:hypothetical protein